MHDKEGLSQDFVLCNVWVMPKKEQKRNKQ